MKLFDEAGNQVDSPLDTDIQRVISGLDDEVNTFAVLEKQSGTYMQTMRFEDGFELEYQIDSTDRHFRASQLLSCEQVVTAMSQYALDDQRWQSEVDWQPLDLSELSEKSGCLSMVLFVGGTAAVSLLYHLA